MRAAFDRAAAQRRQDAQIEAMREEHRRAAAEAAEVEAHLRDPARAGAELPRSIRPAVPPPGEAAMRKERGIKRAAEGQPSRLCQGAMPSPPPRSPATQPPAHGTQITRTTDAAAEAGNPPLMPPPHAAAATAMPPPARPDRDHPRTRVPPLGAAAEAATDLVQPAAEYPAARPAAVAADKSVLRSLGVTGSDIGPYLLEQQRKLAEAQSSLVAANNYNLDLIAATREREEKDWEKRARKLRAEVTRLEAQRDGVTNEVQ